MKKTLAALIMAVMLTALVSAAVDSEEDEETGVVVDIGPTCRISVQEYRMPQGGAIGKGRTGSFFARFKNFGAVNASVNADMNVSYYNRTSKQVEYLDLDYQQELYTHYEKMVDYDNYSTNLTTSGFESFDTYTKWFTAAPKYHFGKYNATLQLDYECPVTQSRTVEKTLNVTDQFYIINASSGISEFGNQTTDQVYPANISRIDNASTEQAVPANVSEPGHIPEDFNRTGWEDANESVPLNFSERGPESANDTLPAEANRSGATGNQSIPGSDEDSPGSYARPLLEIEPVNRTYGINKTRYGPVALRAENVGNVSITDIDLQPSFDGVEGTWESRSATINEIEPGEELTRTVYVRPGKDTSQRVYTVPVTASTEEGNLDLDYFYVDVLEAPTYVPGISILEAPERIRLKTGESLRVPLLLKNTGEKKLTDVSSEIQNVGDCGSVDSSMIESLDVNETASASLLFNASENPVECNTTMIVSSGEGVYQFSRMQVNVETEEALIPPEQQPPIIAIIWTLILAAYSIIRKRYHLDSMLAKAPQLLMIMGETVILLYMTVNYYGIVSVSFLPF